MGNAGLRGSSPGKSSQELFPNPKSLAPISSTEGLGLRQEESIVYERLSPVEKIMFNTRVIAKHYGECVLDEEQGEQVEQAYYSTIEEVVEVLENARKNDPRVIKALFELQLLTEVERHLIEGNLEHLPNCVHGRDSRGNDVVETELKDVMAKFAVIRKTGEREKAAFVGRDAVWSFEPNGIRLRIGYQDTSTGKIDYIHAGMDFHFRPMEGRDQGALDLKGRQLSDAMAYVGDYHRAKYLDEILDYELLHEIQDGRLIAIDRMLPQANTIVESKNTLH